MHTGTFANEDELPRVPLPSLEDSCARFLQWCAPLLDDGGLERTRAAVAAFTAPGSGTDEVHAALAEYAERPDVHSWLDEFWEDRYLGRRDRIALNANFFFLFNDTGDDQISRAVRLITASVDLKLALDAETAPPVTRRGRPQSMVEHRYLFGSTRIPGVVRDVARTPYSAEHPGPSTARHIVVFFRGSAFRLDVIGPEGVPHTPEELAEGLRTVIATAPDRGRWAGALTTKARAEWARSREALLAADPGNPATLDTLETALFCVAIEDRQPGDIEAKCKTLLAGDSGTRWFDKSLTFIVFPDGSAGINGEHCRLDGTAIVEFVDSVLTGTTEEHARGSGARPQGDPVPEPMEFVLTDELVADVDEAAREFDAYADATATRCLSFDGVGSNLAKSLKISPDAFVQLAFQLAHKRSKGFTGATYESINTRHFHHGRTEAMRVVTPEIVEFVSVMDDPTADRAARAAATSKAAEQHVARAGECQAGDAPEQHLWELQLLAKRLGRDWDPELYRSPGWLTMRDDYLSTSAAPSVNIQYFGFGATSTHCIGVAYLLLPETFNVHLSTPASVGAEMVAFGDRLADALTEITGLLAADG